MLTSSDIEPINRHMTESDDTLSKIDQSDKD
jgi:hypothetical protein